MSSQVSALRSVPAPEGAATRENPFVSRGENARKVFQRDPNPMIFRPIALREVKARNRIALSPMCQYCATDGMPDDWHFQHLASRAVGGAGIVFTEATSVDARGRATPNCLGLWNDAQQEAFARIARFVKTQGALAGIQLVHSGRKASTVPPALGAGPLSREHGGWEVIGPSPIAFKEGHHVPVEMDQATIRAVVEQFAASARRSREAGFDIIELHAAHGYLIHEFLSPLSNQRKDAYGSSFENRIRFLLEVVDAVRSEWPDELPLFVRISATDWVEGGWTLDDSVELARRLKIGGKVDLIDCSSGALSPLQRISIYPGYQVQFAQAVRERAGIATGAVGLIGTAEMAESVIASGHADLVFLGRAMLANPYWPMQAAKALRANFTWPTQYERGDVY
jgi:2,4-dienoyl-CoA reductase-like NADH-dependent reductase (Old Yellow Enzyme family)